MTQYSINLAATGSFDTTTSASLPRERLQAINHQVQRGANFLSRRARVFSCRNRKRRCIKRTAQNRDHRLDGL